MNSELLGMREELLKLYCRNRSSNSATACCSPLFLQTDEVCALTATESTASSHTECSQASMSTVTLHQNSEKEWTMFYLHVRIQEQKIEDGGDPEREAVKQKKRTNRIKRRTCASLKLSKPFKWPTFYYKNAITDWKYYCLLVFLFSSE